MVRKRCSTGFPGCFYPAPDRMPTSSNALQLPDVPDEGDGYQQSVPWAYSSMAPETISISFEKTTCSARKVANTCVILESLESNRAQTTFFAPRLQSVGNYSLIMYHRVVIHKNIKWLWSPLITKAGQISPLCILTTPFDCNWQTSLVLWMFYALSVSRYNHNTYVLIHSTWKDSMFVLCLHCFWFEMNSEKKC